jgi:hypothetical protein
VENKNNFKCLSCAHEWFVPEYSTMIIQGEAAYKIKGSFIKCPECESLDVFSIPKGGGYTTNIGKFSSLSNEDKRKCLKMRSDKHSKKHLSERRKYLDDNFTGSAKGLDFLDTSQ